MVVRVEDVLHGFLGDPLRVRHRPARAAGEIGVHDDQVVLHFDDHVIAVTLVHIAFAEPDAGRDEADGLRIGVGPRHEERKDTQSRETAEAAPDASGHRRFPLAAILYTRFGCETET